jgi:hypothetical protein
LELRDVGFSLAALREGGYAWKECVRLLKATHDELVAAGFDGIDARDPLFEQNRPPSADLDA